MNKKEISEFIEVDSIKEIIKLRDKKELYFKDNLAEKPEIWVGDILFMGTPYYKRNPDYVKPVKFKRGQIIMGKDDNSHGWTADVFENTNEHWHFQCFRYTWDYCRLPTEEELKELVPQMFEEEK